MTALTKLTPLHDTAARGPDVLTPALRDWYGGVLAFPVTDDRPYVIGNFVQTVDGIVSFRAPGPEPMFGEPHDRMLMSVLRAWSDAVVIGRGTFAAEPKVSTWHWKTTAPSAGVPGLADELRAMERALASVHPHLEAIVTTRGEDFDFDRKLFRDGDVHAVVATTREGESTLRPRLERSPGASAEIWELGSGPSVDLDALLSRLAAAGRRRVLVEGGPQLYGALEAIGGVDEIFLTHRAMVGGTAARTPRPTFSGVAHAAAETPLLDLVSVRAALETSTLFTRWKYRGRPAHEA